MDDLSKTELLHSLAIAYQLPGEPREIKGFPHYDYVYKLTVGNRHYIAKIGNCWSDSDIRFKIGLQQYLHENGYPIPTIHTTGNGDAVWDVDGVGAILMDFIGSAYDPSRKREQCDAATTTMGWFHREANKPLDIGTCYWDVDAEFEYSQAFNDNARGFLASKPLCASSRQHVADCIDVAVHGISVKLSG